MHLVELNLIAIILSMLEFWIALCGLPETFNLKLVTHKTDTSTLLHLTTPNYYSKHNNGNNASILFSPFPKYY